jgi:hypothetical protein
VEFAAGRLGVAQQGLGARKRVTIFKPGDGGLAGAHSGREFGLGEARAQASPEQLGGNLELQSERVMGGKPRFGSFLVMNRSPDGAKRNPGSPR